MEVYAGFLAHTDAQVGRLIDAIEELGEWDNTLFLYVTGDNGASSEGTLHGGGRRHRSRTGFRRPRNGCSPISTTSGQTVARTISTRRGAWALDAPFQWTKQVASHFGGTRNGLAVSWPAGFAARGELRSQFHHVIDLAPTILEAAGISAPATVPTESTKKPIEGVSMAYSFGDVGRRPVPARRSTSRSSEIGRSTTTAGSPPAFTVVCPRFAARRSHSVTVPRRGSCTTWSTTSAKAIHLAADDPDKLAELRLVCSRTRLASTTCIR